MNLIASISKLPDNELIETGGRWHFVGHASAELAYIRTDGSSPTPEQLRQAVKYGPCLAGLKTRTFDTKAEALKALKKAKQ